MFREVAGRPARCLLVGLGATAGAVLLLAWLLPHLAGTVRGGAGAAGDFVTLLVAACEAVLAGCAGWLWVLVVLVLRDAVRGRADVPRRGVPPVVRRLVLAGCGLSLATGLLAPPATATVVATGADPEPVGELLVGLPVPDRMSTTQFLGTVTRRLHRPAAAPPPEDAASGIPAPGGGGLVVRAGDSLWELAARTLPPGAGDAVIDRRWRLIYGANREVIGADPDLIHPGQRLWLPPDTDPR